MIGKVQNFMEVPQSKTIRKTKKIFKIWNIRLMENWVITTRKCLKHLSKLLDFIIQAQKNKEMGNLLKFQNRKSLFRFLEFICLEMMMETIWKKRMRANMNHKLMIFKQKHFHICPVQMIRLMRWGWQQQIRILLIQERQL